MKRLEKLFIEDMRQAIEKITKYIGDLSFENFVKDGKTIDAVVRNLEIIGEASKNVPEWFKSKYPTILWREIMGMRNKIAHEYFGIDYEVIWEIVKKDLPELEPKIKEIMQREFTEK